MTIEIRMVGDGPTTQESMKRAGKPTRCPICVRKTKVTEKGRIAWHKADEYVCNAIGADYETVRQHYLKVRMKWILQGGWTKAPAIADLRKLREFEALREVGQ